MIPALQWYLLQFLLRLSQSTKPLLFLLNLHMHTVLKREKGVKIEAELKVQLLSTSFVGRFIIIFLTE